MRADPLGAGDALLHRVTEGDAEFFRDRLRLRHHGSRQSACFGKLADIHQRRPRQRTDRIERQIAPRFHPDVRAQVCHDFRLESGAGKNLGQILHPVRLCSVQLCEGKPVAFDLADHTGSRSVRGRIRDGGDDAVRGDIRFDDTVGIE